MAAAHRILSVSSWAQMRSLNMAPVHATATRKHFSSAIQNKEQEGVVKRAKRLVLYSKPGCCLCDGLKEKLHVVLNMGGDVNLSLSDVELEVRDITTNLEWEKAYQYEIPVLARVNQDGSEIVLPRFSPRASFEQLQRKLGDALS